MNQETDPRSVKVIGHCRPDTDSICSAIAYARLKEKLDPEHTYLPCRAGLTNRETKFVLKHFGVEKPRLLTDARPQILDVDYRRMDGVDGETSLRRAWNIMRDLSADTLCIVDEEEKLRGVVSIRDMTTANMDMIDDHILARAGTSYRNLIETLDAEVLAGAVEDKVVEGRIIIGAGSAEMMEQVISPGDVVIVSNRSESQLAAIERDAGCVVVCAASKVSRTIQLLAEEQGCILISTPHDTYVAGQMITQSAPVRHYMKSEDVITFTPHSFVEDATKIMASVRLRYFPILDDDGRYLGMISRRNLLSCRKKQLILVDHNEKSQAVDGVDDAEVLEIIDHHRIGALETESPVYFRNVPVGCTCTIVYQMYQENGIDIEPPIAGLMLSAILSDTLMFRSPTCTPADERAARALADIAGVELEPYAQAMFEAGSDVTGTSPADILSVDYKIFTSGAVRFGVSQNNFMTEKSRLASEELVKPYLQGFMERQSLDYVFCMFTDVPSASTELLMCGQGGEDMVRRAFHVEVADSRAVLPGVVSRKKQLVPALLGAVKQE